MRRPSPSLIVSALALVVASGGTSYAAMQITSKDIKNGTIQSKDIKDGGVKSRDIKDGTIKEKDLKKGLLDEPTGRWALVNANGEIEAQSGGFTVASRYDADPATPAGAVGNVYIDANEDLTDNAIVATIALQNQVDQNGDTVMNGRAPLADSNPEFSGEITATRCNIPGVVACAPTGTNTNEHLVVSPRLSDGTVTTGADRKRFYVVVTGDSTDYVAPAA
jgi:hypothetical protein